MGAEEAKPADEASLQGEPIVTKEPNEQPDAFFVSWQEKLAELEGSANGPAETRDAHIDPADDIGQKMLLVSTAIATGKPAVTAISDDAHADTTVRRRRFDLFRRIFARFGHKDTAAPDANASLAVGSE